MSDEGTSIPRREPTEDVIEASPLRNPTGKFVFVNHNDDDYDARPDYADLENPAEATLVPIVLEIAPDTTWDLVNLRFEYDGLDALPPMDGVVMTDPRNGQPTHFVDYSSAKQIDDGGGLILSPALRIWNVPSPGSTRTADDYIVPGQQYSAAELGFDDSNRERVFFLEGVNAIPQITDPQPTMVTVVANIEGAEFSDEVLVTVVEVNLGVNNSNNRPTLRPGVPDADFIIDEHDELVEDQQEGMRWWRARWNRAQEEYLVDFLPLAVSLPAPIRWAGFEFFLKLKAGPTEDVIVVPNSTSSQLLDHLRDEDVADDVLWKSQWGYCDLGYRDCKIEFSGDEARLLILPKTRGDVVQPDVSEMWMELVAREPNGHNEIMVDCVKITIENIQNFYWLGSLRGNPNTPYIYTTEDGRTTEVLRYPLVQPQSSWDPDPSKTVLVYIHGYWVSEEDAIFSAGELFKRMFWAGYRGTLAAVMWDGDETAPAFDPNVENAFLTSPSMMDFITDYVPNVWGVSAEQLNLIAHSLGNLVMFDALRLYHTEHPTNIPGDVPAPAVNHTISVQPAVWEETLWAEEGISYTNPAIWAIDYYVDDLKHHSWAFWFNQERHPVRQTVNSMFVSRVNADSSLEVMKLNDVLMRNLGFDAFTRLAVYRPHDFRVPTRDNSEVTDGGTADLWKDLPALLKLPFRPNIYGTSDITDPLGMTQAPPAFTVDIFAETFGWRSGKHSDYLEAPIWQILPWYERLFSGNPVALPREEE